MYFVQFLADCPGVFLAQWKVLPRCRQCAVYRIASAMVALQVRCTAKKIVKASKSDGKKE